MLDYLKLKPTEKMVFCMWINILVKLMIWKKELLMKKSKIWFINNTVNCIRYLKKFFWKYIFLLNLVTGRFSHNWFNKTVKCISFFHKRFILSIVYFSTGKSCSLLILSSFLLLLTFLACNVPYKIWFRKKILNYLWCNVEFIRSNHEMICFILI